MKIGFISDTHGILREEVIEHLKGCDYIIHAGDISKEKVLNKLKEIGTTIVVKGNNDKEEDEYTHELNDHEIVNINGFKIYVVHNKKDIPKDLEDINMVVFGHSHKYFDSYEDNVRFFNPGACGKRRFSLPLTIGIGTLENGSLYIEKVEI